VKLITVVLRPVQFDALKKALALFGVRGMTVAQVYYTGDHTERVEMYRGQRFATDLEPRLRVEVLAADDEAPDLVHVIARVVEGGEATTGPAWITPVDWVARVRTGEYGLDAL
jgi:nitrogen regulatory protein P-II 1